MYFRPKAANSAQTCCSVRLALSASRRPPSVQITPLQQRVRTLEWRAPWAKCLRLPGQRSYEAGCHLGPRSIPLINNNAFHSGRSGGMTATQSQARAQRSIVPISSMRLFTVLTVLVAACPGRGDDPVRLAEKLRGTIDLLAPPGGRREADLLVCQFLQSWGSEVHWRVSRSPRPADGCRPKLPTPQRSPSPAPPRSVIKWANDPFSECERDGLMEKVRESNRFPWRFPFRPSTAPIALDTANRRKATSVPTCSVASAELPGYSLKLITTQ